MTEDRDEPEPEEASDSPPDGGDDAEAATESSGEDAEAAPSDEDASESPKRSRRKRRPQTAPDDGDEAAEAAKPAAGDERRDLPKWNRARVKRKSGKDKDQDAFQGAVRSAGKQAAARMPLIIAAVVLVAGGVGGVIWWRTSSREDAAVSTRALSEAVGYRARGRIGDVEALTKDRTRPFPIPLANDEAELQTKVQGALEDLATQAPDSSANRLAILVRGARQVEQGNFADAEAAFEQFLTDHGTGHELSFLAQEGILAAREGAGDLEGALAKAKDMAGEQGDFYRDQALWHQGRLLEQLDRSDEALEVYRTYAEEYPLDKSSIAQREVRARLSELAPELVPEVPAQGGPTQELTIP